MASPPDDRSSVMTAMANRLSGTMGHSWNKVPVISAPVVLCLRRGGSGCEHGECDRPIRGLPQALCVITQPSVKC